MKGFYAAEQAHGPARVAESTHIDPVKQFSKINARLSRSAERNRGEFNCRRRNVELETSEKAHAQ